MGLARAAVVAGCLLLFLTADVLGNKCTVGCHGMNGGKAYQEGHTYIYDLEGESRTSVPGAQDDAILKLRGVVELSVKPDCVRQIRLKGVQVDGTPISLSDVEQYALQFNYHDGHIDTEICTESGDSQASLNIKRAVASLFQSAVFQDSGSTTHHEVDVFGGCPTDFTFYNDGDSLVVKKERNLIRCSHRENIRQGPVSAIYDPKSEIQSAPTLSSHQQIEQRFKRGILNRAASIETYKLKAFNNGDVGAKTVVETTLTLKGDKGDSSATAAVSQPKSLIFEAPHPVIKSSPNKIDAALKATSAEMAGGVKIDAAEKFAEFIKVLRLSTKDDILAVYQKMKGADKAHDKKMFLDALYRAGSGEAAEAVMELIKNHEITGDQLISFYASLALVDHVNLPSVTSIINLLDQPNLPRLGYLGIGQVIGKYCQQHTCDNVPEVKQAVHKIREKIGNGKAKTRDQENLIVSALKALGNTKFLDDSSMQKLASIAEDKNIRNRVRVAAIEALPTRCSMKWKSILLKVLADREEDSEIRIKAYLSLVACACPHVASSLKEMLDKETVNQVGSFIQSHLRNLRASADPNKAEAKRQLGLIKPRTRFPEDFRKFSFNNELSYNLGGLGLGSSAESNVIYSQNSFVPRSINLNLTGESFGRSFNFLDLNMRIENLDRLLEHYFGPKGRFTQDEVSDMVDKGVDNTIEIVEYIKQKFNKMRGKREVKQGELDKFAKGVKLRNNEVDENLDLDLSIKMFGIEMAYMTYNGNTEQLTPNQIIDKMFDKVDAGVNIMKNFNHHVHNHLQFLEAELIYPTNMGIGLSLDMIGTSVVHMKIHGNMDIPAIMKDPENAEVHIGFEPSIAIRMSASMVVKGFDVEAGMKVVGTLHTDTATDVSIKLLDGMGIDVNVKAPKKKQDLLTVSTTVLLSSGQIDKYKPAKFDKGKVLYKDCFDQFSDILTVCGHVEFPHDNLEVAQKKAFFPLNGPSKFSISLENEASNYHMKIYYDKKSPKYRSFEILLETPNSKNNKRISLLAEAGLEPDKYARISVDSPIKKASAEAVLKNNDKEHSLTIKMHNEQHEYFVRAGLAANGAKYKPILEYKVPEHIEKLAGTKLGTKAPHSGGQQYNMDGTVEVVEQNGGKKYVFDKVVLLSSGHKVVGLDGYVLSAPHTAALDMNLGYGDESVALKMEGKKLGEQHYSLGLSALPTKDPNIGFDIKWECRKDQNEFDNKFIFVHGPDLKSETNRLTVKQHIDCNPSAGPGFVLGASSKISYPAMNMVLDLEGKITPNTINGDIEISYEKFKFGTELSAKRNMNKLGDYEVEFEAELLQNKIKLESERKIIDPHKSKYKNSIELSPGGKYEAEAVVLYNHDKNNLKFEMDGDLNLDGKKVKAIAALDTEAINTLSRASLTVGDVKYVDFMFKLRRGTNPQGSLTLNLKNYLNVGGQMSMQGDKGNAQLNIDLPKINRKIKGTGDLTVAGTQHTANFELLLDAEKDPNKRIKLFTVTDMKKNAIDSKNSLEVLDNKIDINCKGKFEGTIREGEHQLDMDVTLPNGRYLVYKIKRTATKNKDDKYDIHVNMEIADHVSKGGPSRQITYVVDANMIDYKTSTLQSNGHIKYTDMDGENGQLDLAIKNLADFDGHKKLFEIAVGLSGTRPINMPHPFNLHYKDSELHNGDLSYDLASSLGKDFQFKSVGNFVPGNNVDKPCTLTGNIEMILPSKNLRNVKLDFKNSLLNQPEQNGVFDLQGSATLVYNDDKTISYEGTCKRSGPTDLSHAHEGDMKIALTILKSPRLVLHDSFKYTPDGDKVKVSRNTIVNYGDKEMTLTIDSLVFNRDMSYIHMTGKATTPYEKLHHVDFTLNHERGKGGHSRTTDVAVTADNEKYTFKSEIESGTVSPKIHIVYTCPKGKTELLSKFEKLGDEEYTGEWKIETPHGFAVADAHVNLQSVDNFVIDVNFDSDKMKHRKLKAEIANRATAKTGRRIVITILSDGKNIVTGSTSYKKRDEAGKITVEGNGHLKIGEDTRSSSFKFSRQQLTHEKDGEVGMVMVLNAKFDPVAIVGELKLSNKEVLIYNNYCEQNKDCAHFKLQSTYDTDHKQYLKHQLTVEVDLKKFNVPAEFGLKTSTECNENNFDHSANLYLHSSKDKSEYTYHIYAHPKESAIILTIPSRELALVGTFDVPKTKQTGAFKVDVSLYLDRKNKPSEKTGLIATGDANVDKDSMSLNGEVKFVYPSQKKDMAVKGRLHYGGEHLLDANVDIDVFAKKSQKINVLAKVSRQDIDKGCNLTSVIEVNSRGQQLKVDLKSHAAFSEYAIGFGSVLSYTDQNQKPKSVGVLFTMDPTELFLLVNAPNKELIRVDARLKLQKNSQKLDYSIAVAGGKPVVTNFEANDWNSFKFVEYPEDDPTTKLTANGRIVLGQLAEIHADAFKGGEKKNLFHILVHLDEGKFLKPDFGYHKDNIAGLMEAYRKHNIQLLKKLKDASIEISNEAEVELKDLVEHLKKAQPNIDSLVEYYQNELTKLKNEFHADQTIKDVEAIVNKHFGAIIHAVVDTMKRVTKQMHELQQQLREIITHLEEMFKAVYPRLKESYDKIFHACLNVLDTTTNLVMAYFKVVLSIINEHQEELKELAVMVSELAHDFAKIVFKAASQIKKDVDEFVELLINQMKALPIYEIAKERYEEIIKFQIPESILASIDEMSNVIKVSLPTEQLQRFFDAAYKYIMKHVKHEKVDDANEIKKIYALGIDALRSTIDLVGSPSNMDYLYTLLEARLPVDLSMWAKLPAISSLKISIFNLLRNNELPTPVDLYYAYRPTLLPTDIVPPFSKVGIVVDGGHFFTFDGNHFSMPGDCNYILVQDMQEGNFSVVANFNKGNLVSVTVTEPKESITLKNNGNILVNNKPADFPASTKNLHAFLIPTIPSAHIKSDYGVHVTCGYKTAMVCTVRVSGFYHGKLRGLLGDGNNEQYDDYMLPSGKITESETEFANAYKLKPDCPAVNAIDRKTQQHNQVCTDYFSGQKSTLKGCFNYINPSYYRDACDNGASANPQAPCLVAAAYYSACYYKRVFGISIPAACANCKVNENTISAGETFSVKSPKNQADITLVIEQVAQNEKIFKELVPSLIADLRDELKQHGITDVHIGLIGYAEHMEWPQHYTSGGNLNIESDVKTMKFEKSDPIITLEEAQKGDNEKKITYLEQRLDVEFGTFKLTDAYEEAVNYPYRPGAVKAVIAMMASPCEKSPLPLSLQHLRLLQGQKIYRDLGLTYYQIYHPADIQVSGKTQKNIVGYDHDSVYVLSDSKKKPLSGNTELRNNMVIPCSDVCADFSIASGGAAFNANNFLDAKPNQKRQFAQVTARKIVEDLMNVEIEKDCVCEQTHGLTGHPHCKIVGRREKEQLAKHTKGGVKG